MQTQREVIFWGAKGHARVLNEALSGSNMTLVALVDNQPLVSPLPGIPVLLGRDGLENWLSERKGAPKPGFALAIGGSLGLERLKLAEDMTLMGLAPVTIVHTRAFVANDAEIGDGSQVLALSAVCANARLGACVIANTSCSIDHDTVIEDGVHVGPGAHIAGEVLVQECAFIGAGAVILPRLKIGRCAIVGAGAVVTRNVSDNQTVVGNPARPLRTH